MTQYVVNDTVTFECATNVTESGLILVTYPSVNSAVLSFNGIASIDTGSRRKNKVLDS